MSSNSESRNKSSPLGCSSTAAIPHNSNIAVVHPTVRPTNQSIAVNPRRPINQQNAVNNSRPSNQTTNVSMPSNQWSSVISANPTNQWTGGYSYSVPMNPWTPGYVPATTNIICSVCQHNIDQRNAPVMTSSTNNQENISRSLPRRRTYADSQNMPEIPNEYNQNGSETTSHFSDINNWMTQPTNQPLPQYANAFSESVPSVRDTIPTVSLIDIGFYDS